jgi:hypothetical protein
MNVKYCPIKGGNFGDTLNTMVWDRLFPDLKRLKDGLLVYGIGTLLDGRHDRSKRKIVLGSGIGEAHAARPDPNWDSYDWERVAADAGMVADRPLMRSINKPKAMANCLARLVQYKEHTRRPPLRAVSSATPIDALRVSQSLFNYARNEGNFSCSRPSEIERQRERMLVACSNFAREYGLRYTP